MADGKVELIRALYEARARRDFDAVRRLLSDDVVWHEPGDEDYSGDYRGREEVVALLAKLVQVTGGTFRLDPREFLVTADHVAARIEWFAERDRVRAEGNEIAVYRLKDDRVAEAWFFPDGFDPEALRKVFAYDG